jgi:ribosomal protein S11
MAITHHFSQDADDVFAAMTSADALTQRCQDLGEKNIQCSVEENGRKTCSEPESHGET